MKIGHENLSFHNRFQRSIRIDTDFNDLDIFDTFVSSETSNKTIIEFCDQVKNGQHAFTWTGSYGSGKSSLAVILNGILSHKNTQLYKKSAKIISTDAINSIENTLRYQFDENNYLSFNTRRNRKIDLTEYYDLIYEYNNDCLTAGIEYKKTYYQDRDLLPTENFMISITLFPLTTYETNLDGVK